MYDLSVGVWEGIRATLARLLDEEPGALIQYPDVAVEDREDAVFKLRLAPWAEEAARSLVEEFGESLHVELGALKYPERLTSDTLRVPLIREDIDANLLSIRFDTPVDIRTGCMAYRHICAENLTDEELVLTNSGRLTAYFVDDNVRHIVGGYSGIQKAVRRRFVIPPVGCVDVPVVVAAWSFIPSIGYSISPGNWRVRIPVGIGGQVQWSPPLSINVRC
jgi:hypothetical protein